MVKTLNVAVEAITQEAEDIKSFRLVAVEGQNLPDFAPGAHIDVHVAPGIVRQYSLCGDLNNPSSYMIAVKREPQSRGGSRGMHETVKAGDVLTISAPRNNFALEEAAGRSLLFAGGIGITPIISMAERLQALGQPFDLHYFTRSPAYTAFHQRLSGGAYADRAHINYALDPKAVEDYLHRLLSVPARGGHVYLCGPKPFMDAVQAAAANWPEGTVHLEYFSADASALAGPREGFEVRLVRQGGVFRVPENKTILEALQGEGVDVDYSCEQGVCGTCVTRVLEGEPDHRDMFMSPAEKAANEKICICVSRAKTPLLVLDL